MKNTAEIFPVYHSRMMAIFAGLLLAASQLQKQIDPRNFQTSVDEADSNNLLNKISAQA